MLEDKEEDYEVLTEDFNKYVIFSFRNFDKLDLYNCRELADKIEEQNKLGKKNFAVDLEPIKYIDSSGLGVIANQAILLSKSDKRLYLLNVNSEISHIFSSVGFDKLFAVVNDRSELN